MLRYHRWLGGGEAANAIGSREWPNGWVAAPEIRVSGFRHGQNPPAHAGAPDAPRQNPEPVGLRVNDVKAEYGRLSGAYSKLSRWAMTFARSASFFSPGKVILVPLIYFFGLVR